MHLYSKNIRAVVVAPLLLLIFGTVLALAKNSVLIDQVGQGRIDVQQSGNENSAEIHQNSKDPVPLPPAPERDPMPAPLGSPASVNHGDYQKTILENPYTYPRARAEVLNEGKTSPVQDPKKTVADAKKILAEEKRGRSKIKIKQQGVSNSASTSQKGKDNDLLIEQRGDNNKADRVQTGDHDHARIIQNGEIVEDK